MELIKWLSIADRHAKMYMDRQLAPLNLNSSHYMYVIKICENPGITQDQFFNFFYVNPSNITRAIAYLEKKGFLIRRRSKEDKRTCRLYPTEKAKKAYPAIREAIQYGNERLMQTLEEQEQKEFQRLIKKIALSSVSMQKENEEEEP